MTPDSIPNSKPSCPDLDEEDYLSFIASQLLQVRHRYQHALAQQEQILHRADSHVQAAHVAQQAVWTQFEDYLLEALHWQEQQSGTARLPCAVGVFRLEEVPGEVTLTDLFQVHEWTRRLSAELVSLSALPIPPPVEPQAQSDETPETQPSLDPGHHAVVNALVTRFYRRTGLLPGGCHLSPARRKPMLE